MEVFFIFQGRSQTFEVRISIFHRLCSGLKVDMRLIDRDREPHEQEAHDENQYGKYFSNQCHDTNAFLNE